MFRHHCFFGCLSALFMILFLLLWLETMWSADEKRAVNYWQHFIFFHHHHDQTLWFYFDLWFQSSNRFLFFLCVCVLISRPAATDGQTLPSDVSTDQSFQPQVPSRLGIELVSWMFVNLSTGPLGPQASKLPPFFPPPTTYSPVCVYTRVLNLYSNMFGEFIRELPHPIMFDVLI